MEKSLIQRIRSRRFIGAILLSFTGLIVTQMAKTTTLGLPEQLSFFESLLNKGFGATGYLIEIVKTHPIPSLLIPSLVAIISYYLRRRRAANYSQSQIMVLHKPKGRNVVVNKPVEQRIRIVAYTPPTFFKEKISQLFKEIRDTQGNVPLWIRYSTSPTAFSWNLGNNRATHKIHVYGEKSYVEEFLSMLNEGIQTEAKYGSSKGFTILNQNPKVWTESLSADKTTNEKLWPVDLKKSAKKQGFFQDLLSASGVLAGLVAILLAISLLKRRNPRDSGAKITRKKALETAMDCINDFAKRSPILKHEEVSEKGWKFILSDYQVNVNSKGAITTIKNVTHHD